MSREQWPERYRVTFGVGEDRTPAAYVVTTTQGELKATAMAAAMQTRRAGDHVDIHGVAIESVGAAPAGADGRPVVVAGDLHDFAELHSTPLRLRV